MKQTAPSWGSPGGPQAVISYCRMRWKIPFIMKDALQEEVTYGRFEMDRTVSCVCLYPLLPPFLPPRPPTEAAVKWVPLLGWVDHFL